MKNTENDGKALVIDRAAYSYDNKKYVFEGLSYSFEKGLVYAVTGRSGSGKTTLLSLMAGLDRVRSGRILVEGTDISELDDYKLRSSKVGVVFQSYNLLPKFTALENVVLSMDISGKGLGDKKTRAAELLKKVGLNEEEMGRRVLKLSGGQQQRVAIARAISFDPGIILADEPTGSLDPET
ncbi:MAG: ATP-binding cassette domain-containing protein, partial [Ruminococcus sp.]|nr:ATP-binding cassette domain-containing protein [Ruminococcus sp.]